MNSQEIIARIKQDREQRSALLEKMKNRQKEGLEIAQKSANILKEKLNHIVTMQIFVNLIAGLSNSLHQAQYNKGRSTEL